MLKAYFDGSSYPTNPGNGIGGYIILNGNNVVKQDTIGLGEPVTSNEAEYLGLYHALDYLVSNDILTDEILVLGDSKLVIEQVFGKWKCKAENLKIFCERNKSLIRRFSNISGKWIPRKQNLADKLTRKPINQVIPARLTQFSNRNYKGNYQSKLTDTGYVVIFGFAEDERMFNLLNGHKTLQNAINFSIKYSVNNNALTYAWLKIEKDFYDSVTKHLNSKLPNIPELFTQLLRKKKLTLREFMHKHKNFRLD
jgi:ribonuclease HI